jgi:pullulanase-type alpha-1,6-glucosidase
MTVRKHLALFLLGVFYLMAWIVPSLPAHAAHTPDPASVTVAGSLQSELGCSDDWQPACAATHLDFSADDQVWQKTFTVPAGNWEYKAPLNDAWTENYGLNAQVNGANIPLSLATENAVKFYYSHETHWITDNVNSIIAVAPGSFQSELGCPGDWQPDCLRSWLQDPDGDGIYVFRTSSLPAGSYEVKVAIGESWSENYGEGGVANGPNIPFTVAADCSETVFTWDSTSKVLTVGAGAPAPQPNFVTIPGSFQSEVGCSGDWQADCAATHLAFDADDGVWQQSFNIPAGSWEYKAAINNSWDENYGQNAMLNGANIPLSLSAAASVKFYYDHATHWVADNQSKIIAVAPGSFQSELGCPGDWQPDCLRSWLEDPDGDGIYTFSTRKLPAGNYETKVAINESWSENYGANGVRDGANISFTVPNACAETFFSYDPSSHVLTVSASGAPRGNITRAQAYWVTEDTIAWKPGGSGSIQADWDVTLYHDEDAGLVLSTGGVQGGTAIPLAYDPDGLPADVLEKFPHLAGYLAFRIPANRLGEIPEALKGQLAIEAKAGDGTLVDATSLQIQGVLDDLYTYNGPLGVTFAADRTPTFRVWAPTARRVSLLVTAGPNEAAPSIEAPMTRDDHGVWSVTGSPSWYGRYYLYEVNVYARSTGRVETNQVTDPYSVSLSRNSQRSQVIDLAGDGSLKPPSWNAVHKPPLAAFEDIVLYELHIRDFSANDPSVPAGLKGTFKAFSLENSTGMRHLKSLAKAGLTHVHLLPAFDIATIDEDKSQWRQPAGDLASFPPDSEEQQARVTAVADQDGFNWGYDPWHYTVPEGSYATDPDGPARIREFREMVLGLDRAGLRTVMDVVYNHTNAAGQNDKSVLDRIVPGYYHRLNADGNIETSTCCQNTASEFNMMEKLMIDSVLTWAREYKVDGFRFDIMGHHMKRNLVKLRQALDALTLEQDGVDGKKVYLYGEGWNFGEVANNARGIQATQANMAGTGIGTFSDRMRDGVRGGGPFSGIQEQGFINGLSTDPNATNQGTPADQLARLLLESDWIRTGIAGALKDYVLEDRFGNEVPASQIDYNGQPAGYTADPQEVISYIEAHDNETLFDAISAKAPVETPMGERVRMQNLGVSLVGFSQGVPFYHAGVELLRSKSMDRNSYNSGDWFNKIDWTGMDNNWGVGLPPARDNQANWPIMQPLLANPALDPTPADIAQALAHFKETLAIRQSTRLLRLRTAEEIEQKLRFHNTGPGQIPGLIVFSVRDAEGEVVVLINARPEAVTFQIPELAGEKLALHPEQRSSADPVVRQSRFVKATGTFRIPGRTAAVFVQGKP